MVASSTMLRRVAAPDLGCNETDGMPQLGGVYDHQCATVPRMARSNARQVDDPIDLALGTLFRAERASQRMTMTELEAKSGVKLAQLSRLLNGQAKFDVTELIGICRALGLDIATVMRDVQDGNNLE